MNEDMHLCTDCETFVMGYCRNKKGLWANMQIPREMRVLPIRCREWRPIKIESRARALTA